jgi:hypothetical protein
LVLCVGGSFDATYSTRRLVDFLEDGPADGEFLKQRVFVDSITRTVFTHAQLKSLTLTALQRMCVGHLKSSGMYTLGGHTHGQCMFTRSLAILSRVPSCLRCACTGAKNKAQLARWMLRCNGCSVSLDDDKQVRNLVKLTSFDTSFAPSAVQTQSGTFKKEMNMHPMADAYKRNFNLIDRFDRSLSDIRLQLQFGSQHQRYHQSLLFVGVVNAWVLLLESKCNRNNPIDKVRRKFPLKQELEQLGLRLVSPAFAYPPSQRATRQSRLSVQGK